MRYIYLTRWARNASKALELLDIRHFEAVSGNLHNVVYSLRSENDYGTLMCWASNTIGQQNTPCMFHITNSG